MKVVTAEYLAGLCSKGSITRSEMIEMFEHGLEDVDVVPLKVCMDIQPLVYAYTEYDLNRTSVPLIIILI